MPVINQLIPLSNVDTSFYNCRLMSVKFAKHSEYLVAAIFTNFSCLAFIAEIHQGMDAVRNSLETAPAMMPMMYL